MFWLLLKCTFTTSHGNNQGLLRSFHFEKCLIPGPCMARTATKFGKKVDLMRKTAKQSFSKSGWFPLCWEPGCCQLQMSSVCSALPATLGY